MTAPTHRVLDRLPEVDPVALDRYPIRSLVDIERPLRAYTWRCEPHLDQGDEGECVAFGWTHEAAAVPVSVPVSLRLAHWGYRRAQQLDGFPDTTPGTSVIAGARAFAEAGYLLEYRWASPRTALRELLASLAWKGPAVLGLNWTTGMFYPDSDGVIKPTGVVEGGHCVLANGLSLKSRRVRIHQSWGAGHGAGGDVFIDFDHLGQLLADDGEVCVPVRRGRGALPSHV